MNISIGTDKLDQNFYNFYKKLQEIYPTLLDKIIPIITNEFKNWKEDFQILDFNNEFNIDNITIPNVNIKPLDWEISYTTIHDKNHWINISFTEFEPTGIMIDG